MSTPPARSIREQIRHAVDPRGERLPLMDAIGDLAQVSDWLTVLSGRIGQQLEGFTGLRNEYQGLLTSMEDALTHLVPRGWAPFNMTSDKVKDAVRLVGQGRGAEADELLAEEWDARRIDRICSRVRVLGAGHRQRDYEDLFHQRARLLTLARDHHEKGSYEASIPIVHAQMEGIVMDVTRGKQFFTASNRKADVIEPATLVGVEGCLAALQSVFGQSVPQTQASGSLSRHGIAHGRELAYDTRTNSAKSWSVLDALVEWARPMAEAEAAAREAELQFANAGSSGVDADGRRLDDREFRATREALWMLHTSSMGWWDRRQRFRDDLVDGLYQAKDFVKKGLPQEHGIRTGISADGQVVWHWRATVSGWVLGLCTSRWDDRFAEWQYAAPTAPSGSPFTAAAEWGAEFETLPDWT